MGQKSYLVGLTGRSLNDKYLLKDLLGYGGDSVVFQAERLGSGQSVSSVAIKLIEINTNKEDEQLRELEIATRLKHKHLINCYEFFRVMIEQNPVFGLVMEFADYSLEEYLDSLGEQPLDFAEREAIIDSTLQALSFIHSQSIVHRDIKPGNILKVGEVWKVADFGISRVLNSKTSTKTMHSNGTFLFMPPEASDGVISPAWDMWSLGILISRLFSEKHPFSASNDLQLFHKILYEPPILPASLNILYQAMIQGCLIKSRTDRWSVSQVLEYFEVAKESNRNEAAIESFRQKMYEKIEDLKQHDDYHAIIDLCDIVLYLKPNCIEAWQNKADAYFCLGKTQESLETYRLALHRLADGSPSVSFSVNGNLKTLEQECLGMAEPRQDSYNGFQETEVLKEETQSLEGNRKVVKTITENIRSRFQSLGRFAKRQNKKI